jgi:hypothetical protein
LAATRYVLKYKCPSPGHNGVIGQPVGDWSRRRANNVALVAVAANSRCSSSYTWTTYVSIDKI